MIFADFRNFPNYIFHISRVSQVRMPGHLRAAVRDAPQRTLCGGEDRCRHGRLRAHSRRILFWNNRARGAREPPRGALSIIRCHYISQARAKAAMSQNDTSSPRNRNLGLSGRLNGRNRVTRSEPWAIGCEWAGAATDGGALLADASGRVDRLAGSSGDLSPSFRCLFSFSNWNRLPSSRPVASPS